MDLHDSDPDRARAAALLRRSALAVPPDQVSQLADESWDDGVDRLLDTATITARSTVVPPVSDDWRDLLMWWLDQMSAPDTGVVDRLMWFWHGHLTTHAGKVGSTPLLQRQMTLLRAEALGNYRSLLQSFVVDGAFLRYLDGDGSEAHNPNENLARELMELFTIGREQYTQDDVRAAARALAGWRVVTDGDEVPRVVFRRDAAFVAPLLFLGEQDEWNTERIVDRLCDHPATAVNVASKLWADLVGTELEGHDAEKLGAWWQDQNLEILPLVDRILRSDAARSVRYGRARSGIEWFAAALAAARFELDNPWWLDSLGQMPYQPPNVSGWPVGDRWLAPGSLLHRGRLVFGIDLDRAIDRARTVDQVLTACGIESVSTATREALDAVDREAELDADSQARLRWRLTLNAPEFHLS